MGGTRNYILCGVCLRSPVIPGIHKGPQVTLPRPVLIRSFACRYLRQVLVVAQPGIKHGQVKVDFGLVKVGKYEVPHTNTVHICRYHLT